MRMARSISGATMCWRFIRETVSGPVILIGSSMGGWLMLLVAEALGEKVQAMVGIAAAPDFTDWDFSEADKATIEQQGRIERPSDYGYDPMVITHAFWRSGPGQSATEWRDRCRLPGAPWLHGQNDPDVPWDVSVKLAARLRSSDVQTLLIKDGDHRLSRDEDIMLLIDTVAKLAS